MGCSIVFNLDKLRIPYLHFFLSKNEFKNNCNIANNFYISDICTDKFFNNYVDNFSFVILRNSMGT